MNKIMIYRFAEKDSFQYLSAGSVIKSYKGNTNFPVSLGHEIFNRCLNYIDKKEKVAIFDPMCGSGYLLTTVGLLNFNKISKLYGSDFNEDVLNVARKNLRLHTIEGLKERENEIQNLSFAGFSRHRSVLPDRNELRNPQRQLTNDRCTSLKKTACIDEL